MIQDDNKVFVSWEQVNAFVDEIISRYGTKHFSGVYGLPRGGLTLATMISYKLNVPLLLAPFENCLIVDDICDTGESLLHYIANSSNSSNKPKYTVVTMFYKDNTLKIKPEYFMFKKADSWISFPWE